MSASFNTLIFHFGHYGNCCVFPLLLLIKSTGSQQIDVAQDNRCVCCHGKSLRLPPQKPTTCFVPPPSLNLPPGCSLPPTCAPCALHCEPKSKREKPHSWSAACTGRPHCENVQRKRGNFRYWHLAGVGNRCSVSFQLLPKAASDSRHYWSNQNTEVVTDHKV